MSNDCRWVGGGDSGRGQGLGAKLNNEEEKIAELLKMCLGIFFMQTLIGKDLPAERGWASGNLP